LKEKLQHVQVFRVQFRWFEHVSVHKSLTRHAQYPIG